MSWVASAVVASAVIGGVASNNASKKAAKASKAGTDAQLQLGQETNEMTERMADQARDDVNRLFGQQEQNSRAGIQSGLDLYKQTIPAQFEQARAGNMAAQQQLSGGLQQQNNAILGNAIDYSQFQPRAMPQIDTNMFNVPLPEYQPINAPVPDAELIQNEPTTGYPRGGGQNQFDRDDSDKYALGATLLGLDGGTGLALGKTIHKKTKKLHKKLINPFGW